MKQPLPHYDFTCCFFYKHDIQSVPVNGRGRSSKRSGGSRRKQVTVIQRNVREKLHDLCAQPNTFRVMKSRKVRWPCMWNICGRRKIYIGFRWWYGQDKVVYDIPRRPKSSVSITGRRKEVYLFSKTPKPALCGRPSFLFSKYRGLLRNLRPCCVLV